MSLARVLARRLHVSARRHALTHFNMPAMSPTMTEGGIASWKKSEGESFSAGDVLLEIETDKATIDVEAQEDGILAKVLSADGSKGVKVGSVIAIIGEEGDDLSAAAEMAAKAASGDGPAPPKEEPAPPKKDDTSSSPSPPPPSTPSKSSSETKSSLAQGDRIFASPIAKKIALEKGIPLGQIKGSGPEGRILREDVEKYKPSAASAAAAATPDADYVDTPTSNMRRSKQELPHYYVTVDINMDKVLKLREVFNKTLTEKEKGAKLSSNSAWLGEVIRTRTISVAVATPNGLITPIIKDKAREGKLAPTEYQGGTFTISNMGMFDVSHFTAIINPPQSCILAVGSTTPTLVPAPEEERGFKTIQNLKVTLSSDHRTVDGAVAGSVVTGIQGVSGKSVDFHALEVSSL
ncbi:pyruvate dehydrogenase [Flagelloscypha sp. PMI_526]|nr:pyruvate dehydrogenase [Flagelloscypha sp. PMI_526]